MNNSKTGPPRQSGYNLELFLDSEEAFKYLCSICHHVVSDCHETRCGHIFCGYCIDRILDPEDLNSRYKCPACSQLNSHRPHQSTYLNRAVKNLRVKCPFSNAGCAWVGALSDLMVNQHAGSNGKSAHLMQCDFAPITCDECGHRICRKEMEQHRKQCAANCANCKVSFVSASDRATHYQKCPILIACKYCAQKVAKNSMHHHISFLCEQRSTKCPFYHFGCHAVLKSSALSAHLKFNAAQHYQLKVDASINKLDKMTLQMESLLRLNDEQSAKHSALEKQVIEMKKELKLQKMYNANNGNANDRNAAQQSRDGKQQENCGPSNTRMGGIDEANRVGKGPDVLFLFGSTKWEETGVFIRRHQLHEGRVCYTSLRTKCAIRWNQELMAWLIDRRGLAKDNEASLIAYQDVAHPGLVTQHWLVYNDDVEEWQQSNDYRIKSYNLAEFIFKADQIFAGCASIATNQQKALNIGGGGKLQLTTSPPPSNKAHTHAQQQNTQNNARLLHQQNQHNGNVLPPGFK